MILRKIYENIELDIIEAMLPYVRNFKDKLNILRDKTLTDKELLVWLEQQANKDENGCWNWPLRLNRDGYAQVSHKGNTQLVHRLVYSLNNNLNLKANQLILHLCDNRKCFRLDHLKLGNNSENMKQSYIKKPYNQRNIQKTKINNIKHLSLSEPQKVLASIEERCIINEKGCWLYPLAKNETYGKIKIENITYRVHRLMLCLKINKKYDEIDVTRHTCHIKNCCNPSHLLEGSNSENMLDSREYSSILAEEDVREILLFSISNEAQNKSGVEIDKILSKKYMVSAGTIQSIRRGNTWKDIFKEIINDENRRKLKKRYITEDNVREVLIFSISDEAELMFGKDIDKKFAEKFGVKDSSIHSIRAGMSRVKIYNSIINDENRHMLIKKQFKFRKQK